MKCWCWLVHILGVQDSDANGILEMCTTYKQKIGLLPHLTESVSYRVIRNKLKGIDHNHNAHVVVNVYPRPM